MSTAAPRRRKTKVATPAAESQDQPSTPTVLPSSSPPVRRLVPATECPPLVEQAIGEANGDLAQAYVVWRRLNGLEQSVEFFDLDPDLHRSLADGIPQGAEFEPFAESRLWWWRWLDQNESAFARVFRPTTDQAGVPNQDYGRIVANALDGVFDVSAFFYELRARIDGRRRWDFGVPWPACSLHQRMFLACVWPSGRVPKNYVPGMGPDTRFADILMRRVNLRQDDGVLLEQFAKMVEQKRREAGLPQVTKGGVRKDLPWRNIELADRRWLTKGRLSEGERSQLSKKIREYGALCQRRSLNP